MVGRPREQDLRTAVLSKRVQTTIRLPLASAVKKSLSSVKLCESWSTMKGPAMTAPVVGLISVTTTSSPPAENACKLAQKRRPVASKAMAVSPSSKLAPLANGNLVVVENVRPAFVET